MLKTLKRDDTTLSPYIATKNWDLSNIANTDLILAENGNPVAVENVTYEFLQTIPNYNCKLAKEDQPNDLAIFREGLKTSGLFYPDLDPQNIDGTYKRMVYSQIKTMFYNNYRNPTQIWGTEKIDFDLSGTKKFLSDLIKVFYIPTSIMGEKIIEGSVQVKDNTLDNDYLITDDGQNNLFAGTNLFSKQQEIGKHPNIFATGSDSFCNSYFNNSNIFNSFSGSLSGLMWQIPSTGNRFAPFGPCISPADQNITLSGSLGILFDVTLRIRGIIELKPYVGGITGSDSHVNIDGSLPVTTFNTYKLVISNVNHTYYLNNGTSGPVSIVDYTFVVQMKQGASLTLHADDGGDGVEVYNNSFLSVPINPGDPPILVTQPYIGQFLQMDVISVIPN